MKSKDLKLMAGDIIMESEYSNSAKKQLLKFVINEASEDQLKALILDGKIESLSEDAIDIVNKRFEISLENILQENLDETQEFLEIGRETICDLLESADYDLESFEQMIDFVVNEATDYQILSMLMEGILPEETEDIEKGMILTENLNEFAGTTFILTERDPVHVDDVTDMINRLQDKIRKLGAWQPSAGGGAHKDIARNRPIINALKSRIQRLKGVKANLIKKGSAAGTPGSTMGGTQTGRDIMRVRQGTKAQQIKGAAKNIAAKAGETVGKTAGAVSKFATSPTGQAVGGLAAAALIGYAAYKIYKNFFSKAAKACKGSADKGACMKQYKTKAVQAQIAKLSSGMGQCSKSKDPAKCKAAVQNKIAKLKGQARA